MGSSSARVQVEEDTVIGFRLNDPYWTQLLSPRYEYEPELGRLLRSLAARKYLLLDCGANLGYWSAVASSRAFGEQDCVAIEASPATFEWLKDTWRSNGERFAILNRAIHQRSDESVSVERPAEIGDHASVQVHLEGADGSFCDAVETVCIVDLLSQHRRDDHELVLVKLDVEGAEIPALIGADLERNSDLAVIYEDHGSDSSHRTTQFVLKQTACEVYFLTLSGPVLRIHSAQQLTGLKTSRKKGYNLLAVGPTSPIRELLEGGVLALR